MNEWASKIMNSISNNGSRADFDRYMSEVRSQNLEHMSYQKEFDEELETRPSYEQVSQEAILDEANKNIMILKSLENIMQERMQAYTQFLNTLSKVKSSFEVFHYCSGSLRQALDSFFLFIEQELQQARQQITLNDIRRTLSEVKVDAQKRLVDYQKEIINAEKEVTNAEKKLIRTKEQLEKHINWKEHVESEATNGNSRNSSIPKASPVRETSRNIERVRDSEELSLRYEREIKDDIRAISRALTVRDEVMVASRKAYQNLDRDCKRAIGQSLKKLITRERETNAARNAILDKLEATVNSFDVEGDITEFIITSRQPDSALILQSQALNILGDLNPNIDRNNITNSNDGSQRNSPSPDSNSSSSSSSSTMLNSSSYDRLDSDHNSSFKSTSSGKEASIMNPNSQAFSQLIFSVHNMFNAGSALFQGVTPPGTSNSPTKSTRNQSSHSNSTTPTQDKRRTSNPFRDKSSPPSSSSTATSNESFVSSARASLSTDNSTKGSAESLMEFYLNSIFYAKKGFEMTSAQAVAFALSPKRNSSSSSNSSSGSISGSNSPMNTSSKNNIILTAAEALNHCLNSVPSKGSRPNSIDPSKSGDTIVKLEEAVAWLVHETDTAQMRSIFISELNKFRSKKVDVGLGFMALGAVLWAVLMQCQATNDVHSAKVVMMLIQTFYRKRVIPLKASDISRRSSMVDSTTSTPRSPISNSITATTVTTPLSTEESESTQMKIADDDEGDVDRGVAQREYLKEILVSHPIWQDGNFWEQVLWQCAVEQLQTVPYTVAWHDMDRDKRQETVVRIHNIIFSQVMAIAHSMLELGCSKPMIREFVYRMCVIHQLSEAQRQQMLVHLSTR